LVREIPVSIASPREDRRGVEPRIGVRREAQRGLADDGIRVLGEANAPASIVIAFELKAPACGLAFGADFLLHCLADDQVAPGEIGEHAIIDREPEPVKPWFGKELLEHGLIARELAGRPAEVEWASLGIAAR